MAEKKQVTRKTKSGKPSLGVRFKRFFSNIRSEVKRVVWPDRRKLFQSTVTVLIIILAAAVVIWAFDSIINLVLTKIGFYTPAEIVTEATEAGAFLPVFPRV